MEIMDQVFDAVGLLWRGDNPPSHRNDIQASGCNAGRNQGHN